MFGLRDHDAIYYVDNGRMWVDVYISKEIAAAKAACRTRVVLNIFSINNVQKINSANYLRDLGYTAEWYMSDFRGYSGKLIVEWKGGE